MAVALRLSTAGPLKPEIRLAQALSEYEAILSDDQKTLLREYKGQPAPDAADVMRLTAEIDRNRKPTHLSPLPRSTLLFATLPLPAKVIWVALKMTLHITVSFTSYFESLSTLFMNVGRTCPRYQPFGLLYPKSPSLRRAVCEYFIMMVELCKRAVLFIKKPFFAQISSAILKPFQSEFGRFEPDLAGLAFAIRDEVSLAAKQERSLEVKDSSSFRVLSAKFSEKVMLELEQAMVLNHRMRRVKFLDACSVYNHETAWRQARKSGTSLWIFDQGLYRRWIEALDSGVLWCTGIVGSRKTVMTANVIENAMTCSPDAVVGYFLCRYDVTESLKARTVVGSLVRQLLNPLKADVFRDVDSVHTNMLDTDQVICYLEKLLPSTPHAYFVVIEVLYNCGSLLIVEEEELTVQFAHHSVKQFLLSELPDHEIGQYHVDAGEADLRLGEICVTYLNFEEFGVQLVKRQSTSPSSEPIHVPSAVLSAALPQATVSRLAIKLLKRRDARGYDWKSQAESFSLSAEEKPAAVPAENAFLPYAQDNWLLHTKEFGPASTACYGLWDILINGKAPHVKIPWASTRISLSDRSTLGWIVDNEHSALFMLIFSRFEGIHRMFDTDLQPVDTLFETLRERDSNFLIEDKLYGLALSLAARTVNSKHLRFLLKKRDDWRNGGLQSFKVPVTDNDTGGCLGTRSTVELGRFRGVACPNTCGSAKERRFNSFATIAKRHQRRLQVFSPS
ncbi:hypothetical protein A1O1_02071 [Capronia coronata CBS 617.96]|uniref:NACHT domain-containing protein n=1 Tax=Capronia coronata CBS 617.96 TaxID=1182541 RepID=W9ZGP3_9EURO|nr:uncharacterized protein A1O1_02071 [Capronia coronata CBS 617.96]EXJ93679.1 hypothetical protein A1O1_02071 [Capronia coronata CBS 617.96]